MRYVCLLLAVLPCGPVLAQQAHDCVIEPSLVLALGSPVEGVVDSVIMERGATVTKGQVLAQLDASIEMETLELAQTQARSTTSVEIAISRLDLAKKELERAEKLVERKVNSASTLDEAQAAFKQATLELKLARENQQLRRQERDRAQAILEQRTVRSPIDGILLRRLIGPGEYVYSQAQIAQIAKIDPLFVDVFLDISHYDDLSIGQTAVVRPSAPVLGEYRAEITSIDQVFDAASDTFGVRLHLPNPDKALPGGIDCTVVFDGGS